MIRFLLGFMRGLGLSSNTWSKSFHISTACSPKSGMLYKSACPRLLEKMSRHFRNRGSPWLYPKILWVCSRLRDPGFLGIRGEEVLGRVPCSLGLFLNLRPARTFPRRGGSFTGRPDTVKSFRQHILRELVAYLVFHHLLRGRFSCARSQLSSRTSSCSVRAGFPNRVSAWVIVVHMKTLKALKGHSPVAMISFAWCFVLLRLALVGPALMLQASTLMPEKP